LTKQASRQKLQKPSNKLAIDVKIKTQVRQRLSSARSNISKRDSAREDSGADTQRDEPEVVKPKKEVTFADDVLQKASTTETPRADSDAETFADENSVQPAYLDGEGDTTGADDVFHQQEVENGEETEKEKEGKYEEGKMVDSNKEKEDKKSVKKGKKSKGKSKREAKREEEKKKAAQKKVETDVVSLYAV
ncbi:FK506-binding protein 3, partial [Aplysia californica]|uniref:FK506-binding protein 3 n=1 Tax=Aplysia californica TaxID=6500 RepID=A0ABM1A4B9_APLCA